MSSAANYSATRTAVDGIEIVRLTDASRKAEVSVAPSVGNIAYEYKVNGKNAFWFPFRSVSEFKAKPVQCGNPFLWPWANRIDQDAYWVNGQKYLLNAELGNFRRDGNGKPIHGLVTFTPAWVVTAVKADGHAAWVTSRLEFSKYPEWMAQFPFAHTVEMTYRLADGSLEVETVIDNHSAVPLPVAAGFHPYFELPGVPRDQWKVHLAARDHLKLSNLLIPTGEKEPVRFADPYPLEGTQLDDVFSGLIRGSDGKAHFWVEGGNQKLEVIYGSKYQVAVVYAPRGRNFICFEPMAAVTNAFNLAHAGVYTELQTAPPGGQWRETFRIAASGF